jgi:hypothetical protein
VQKLHFIAKQQREDISYAKYMVAKWTITEDADKLGTN